MFGKISTLQQEGMGRSLHDDQNIHPNQDRMKGNVNKCWLLQTAYYVSPVLQLLLLLLSVLAEMINGFNKSVAQGYATGRWDETNLRVFMCFKGLVENMQVQTSLMALCHPIL